MFTDLTLIQANGPKCNYASTNSVEYTHHFKVDSSASGNLLPLCLYRKIFPNVTQYELKWSIDHRVQSLAYKKVIKQLGVCYLHVKNSQGHTKLCKFFIVNSKFNPIIGVNCALRLGLTCFKTLIFQNWSDNMPTDAVDKNTTCIPASTSALSGNVPLKVNVRHNFPQMPEIITKDWIIKNPKYSHLFQDIGHFNCKPVTIELQGDAEPIRKAPHKVPLALKEIFSAEIQSIVQQGILSEVTQSMEETPEWLNSFVIVKKPNGNLCICLDPTDLNKHIIQPVCNMYTLEDIVNRLKDATHFAVFDSTKSFFHVPLDEASKKLMALLTPIGIFIYNVLAMGVSNATDIFEKCMRET